MTPFYVLGGILAAWALIVTALGVTRPGFPGKGIGERVVGGISVLLVTGAIGSAILTAAAEEEEEGGGEAAAAEAEGGATAGETLELRAEPSGQLAFDKTELAAGAGTVTLTLDNPSPLPHDVSIEGDGVEKNGEVVERGGTSTVTAELGPGTYTFYCSVPGHREGGMEGTLTVGG